MSENGKLWPVLTFEVVFLIIDIAMGMSLSTLTFIKKTYLSLYLQNHMQMYMWKYMHLVANKTLL